MNNQVVVVFQTEEDFASALGLTIVELEGQTEYPAQLSKLAHDTWQTKGVEVYIKTA